MKITLLALFVLSVAGCSEVAKLESVCPADLRWTLQPQDTTVRVGSMFTASLKLYGCGGKELLSDSITYASSNTDVVTVEPNTGIVRTFRVGDASVSGTAHQYRVTASVNVHVRAQ